MRRKHQPACRKNDIGESLILAPATRGRRFPALTAPPILVSVGDRVLRATTAQAPCMQNEPRKPN